MKRIKKSSAPQVLLDYAVKYKQENLPCPGDKFCDDNSSAKRKNPWDKFCDDNSSAKRKVQEQLRRDQRGICAYCEIDFIDPPPRSTNDISGLSEPLKSDFRVDHFHPKSDKSDDLCWALDWNNLFGVCCGGDEKLVVGKRYCRKVDRHRDYRKHDDNLDDVILNPLEIPAFPCLFKVKCGKGRNGKEENVEEGNFPEDEARLYVDLYDENLCSDVSSEKLEKAQNSIRILRLNCRFLSKKRYEAIDTIYDEIKELTEIIGEEEAKNESIRNAFSEKGDWLPFFTSIRAYFGEDVEERLREIGYDG